MIDLPSEQLAQVRDILKLYAPNTPVWAFGSRAQMTANKHSDLDIVIVGERKIPQKTLYQLIDAFEESELPIKIDVLDWHRISEAFQNNIKQQYTHHG